MNTPRRVILAIAMLVLVAAALRIPGYFTDFWLDEIWSYDIARGTESGHIDNNHLLNTWLIKAIGVNSDWHVYRAPPLLFGIGSVVLAAIIMRRRGNAQMLIAATMFTFSFPFVFYSSEARGYAPAVFFALLALEAMLRFAERQSLGDALLFGISCILGFCAHLTFVHFCFAACFWTILLALRIERQPDKRLLIWLKLNALPGAFFVVLYFVFIRGIVIGGAAARDSKAVLIETLSVPLGGPPVGVLAVVVASIAVLIVASSLVTLLRRHDPLWLFFALSIILAPVFFLVYDLVFSAHPQPLMLRYFRSRSRCSSWPQPSWARLWDSGPPGRVMIVAMLIAFAGANVFKTMNFYRFGRGGYSRAISRIYADSRDPIVTVDADNEFASGRVVDFYAPRVAPPGRSINFYGDHVIAARPAHPPEWVIVSGSSAIQEKRRVRVTSNNEVYRLDSEYPSESLSGIPWLLYRIDIPATIQLQSGKPQSSGRSG